MTSETVDTGHVAGEATARAAFPKHPSKKTFLPFALGVKTRADALVYHASGTLHLFGASAGHILDIQKHLAETALSKEQSVAEAELSTYLDTLSEDGFRFQWEIHFRDLED